MLKALVTAIFLTISHYHHHSTISSSRNLLSSHTNSKPITYEENMTGFINKLIHACNRKSKAGDEPNINIPLDLLLLHIQYIKDKHSTSDTRQFSFYTIAAFIYIEKNEQKQQNIGWLNVHMIMMAALSISFQVHNSPSGFDPNAYRADIAKSLSENGIVVTVEGMYLISVISKLLILILYLQLSIYRIDSCRNRNARCNR